NAGPRQSFGKRPCFGAVDGVRRDEHRFDWRRRLERLSDEMRAVEEHRRAILAASDGATARDERGVTAGNSLHVRTRAARRRRKKPRAPNGRSIALWYDDAALRVTGDDEGSVDQKVRKRDSDARP